MNRTTVLLLPLIGIALCFSDAASAAPTAAVRRPFLVSRPAELFASSASPLKKRELQLLKKIRISGRFAIPRTVARGTRECANNNPQFAFRIGRRVKVLSLSSARSLTQQMQLELQSRTPAFPKKGFFERIERLFSSLSEECAQPQNSSPTPSATSTPTSSSTPQPNPSASQSPSPTTTPSLNPTQTPQATPTPTRTPTPSATPTTTPSVQTLVPGSGFSTLTATPAGSGTIPIADWNVVPYDVVSAARYIGVIAFHPSGIQKVSFSVDNGPFTDVTQMTPNPHTATSDSMLSTRFGSSVREYWVALDPAVFSTSKLAEIRAIIYPVSGKPLVLQGSTEPVNADYRDNDKNSLFLHISKNNGIPRPTRYVSTIGSGSACTQVAPCQSIATAASSIQNAQGNVNHGIIYLSAGTYDGSIGSVSNTQAWLKIAAAPGIASPSAVTISSFNSGNRPKFVQFENLRIMATVPYGPFGPTNPPYVWHNKIEATAVLSGEGRAIAVTLSSGQWSPQTWHVNRGYATDVHLFNLFDGLRGFRLVRNARMHHMTDAFISEVKTAINVMGYDLGANWRTWPDVTGDGVPDSPHPDVYQGYARTYNALIYGLEASDGVDSRGIAWAGDMSNAAIIDGVVDTTTTGGVGAVFDFGGTHTNVFIKDSFFKGGAYWLNTFNASNVVLDNVVFMNTGGGFLHGCPDSYPSANTSGVTRIGGSCPE